MLGSFSKLFTLFMICLCLSKSPLHAATATTDTLQERLVKDVETRNCFAEILPAQMGKFFMAIMATAANVYIKYAPARYNIKPVHKLPAAMLTLGGVAVLFIQSLSNVVYCAKYLNNE